MIRSLLVKIIQFQLPIWLVLPLFGFVFLSGLGGGYALVEAYTPASSCSESESVCEEFTVFWQVWDIARDNFVDPDSIDPERMIDGAVNGMLDTLGDQGHTRFLSAKSAKQWDQSLAGEYEGIGAYLDMREGQAIISAPISGSPAEKAGLKSGDFIMKIDDTETRGLSLEEVARSIRGPKDTTVELTILRPNKPEPFVVSVKRDKVELPSVQWTMLPNDIAWVRLEAFSQRSGNEVKEALAEAQAQGAKKLIFDIRDNHGGLVHEAMEVSSQFLPEGTTLLLEQDRTGKREASKAEEGGVALDIPMVVLINFGTASSAEIVSGALQDENRATLIGTRTVGTGTVLTPYSLQGGSKLLLGTLQWLTPEGRLIRGQGITPDIEIALPMDVQKLYPIDAQDITMDELQESEDNQLLRAIEILDGQENTGE